MRAVTLVSIRAMAFAILLRSSFAVVGGGENIAVILFQSLSGMETSVW